MLNSTNILLNRYFTISRSTTILLFLVSSTLYCQSDLPALDFDDYDVWQKISNEQISPNGSFVVYHEVPGKGDQKMHIKAADGSSLLSYTRGESSSISADSRFVVFIIKSYQDSIRAAKRKKTKEDEMPKDSLGIYNTLSGQLTKIPNIKSYSLPEEWNGYLTYTLDKVKAQDSSDTTKTDSAKTLKPKKVSDNNGYHLIVHNLERSIVDTLKYVKEFKFAKNERSMVYHTSGIDSIMQNGVYYYNFSSGTSKPLATGDYQYEKLAISDDGTQAAFLQEKTDPKSYVSGYQLKYWSNNLDSATIAVNADELNNDWIVNQHQDIRFSQDGSQLYFYTSPAPIIKDTTLLEDEIIQVEIWSYKDQRLQTQQNVEQEKDEKKGYEAVYHTMSKEFFQLADEEIPELSHGNDKDQNHRFAFGSNSAPYMKQVTWEGFPRRADISLVDQLTGTRKSIVQANRGSGDISPSGKFLYWYNVNDTAYYAYNIETEEIFNISEAISTSIVDELDDHPDFPNPYGIAGWTADDKHVLIYDRYDLWKIDPSSPTSATLLTAGRKNQDRYRIRKLDSDRPFVDFNLDLIHVFNESSREESLVRINENKQVTILLKESRRLRILQKAKNADILIYTSESHSISPDIQITDMNFAGSTQLSDINPQQKDKNWSTVEMITWTSLDGLPLEGLLYKPENFDSTRLYPMIVYFYERNSDNIHRYWGATPIRSIINPAFYASRGYLVFIPDIVYRDGYPGPSCYNAVMPGVTHLINKGYVDIDRIGMQGHSWGGYQTAYLATRTNLFACAESGAPVANMTSAYGGIRWGSGLSRMFQYERSQTRLGGTLWELPMRYFENSPIFFVDKINTPMLLMHNDHDTAVPWYQGIELFGALRRLNKPVWMLNYNNEPHWPTKRENIVDFNIRMQQFFDHYLMDIDVPEWMDKGIPAIEKGYNTGY